MSRRGRGTRDPLPGVGDREGRGGGGREGFSYPKAVLLAVAAVALGAYLLELGNGRPSSAAPPTTTTTTTTAPGATTTTTAPATTTTLEQPTQSVKVLVANASTTNGVAAFYTNKLSAAGWGTLTPVNATTVESGSIVYYATGEQPAAASIAASLGVPASAVQPTSSSMPVQGATGASVVVVAGADLAAKTTTGTSG